MVTTIHDIARIAGVGVGTVSRVINNSPGVRPATREKVLSVIAELRYRPDPIARSMISKRTDAIGVVVPFFTRAFIIEMLKGVESALARLGKQLVIYNVENDGQRDRYFTELPMRRKVDGLLIISLPVADSVIPNLKDAGLQVVLVDAYNSNLTSLVVDNIQGAYEAVKYLLSLGHRRIGFINGIIEGNFKFNQANDRLIGFHRALGDAGLPFSPELVHTSEWSRQGGKMAAMQLLTQINRPTAIFAASDVQAIGVIEAARALHIEIPGELSVIGYDGIEISELLELTTMSQPTVEMGELGITRLIKQIEHPDKAPELIRFNATLIERHTTSRYSVEKGADALETH
jgi:LacI family transcriptional regulator